MEITITPGARLVGSIMAPGSKNYTSRFLLAAALADGASTVVNPARIDDAAAMVDCCRQLGARITPSPEGFSVVGTAGAPRVPGSPLNVRNAGAVCRFLLAIGALLPDVRFVTPYPDSLGRRSHADLLAALERLGVRVESEGGRLPVRLRGGPIRGGQVAVSGARSSQFVSALLLLAPLLPERTEIKVLDGLVSRPAVEQTLEVLAAAGVECEAAADRRRFVLEGGQGYRPGRYVVPGDWPAAAAILCAAAVAEVGSEVEITGLLPDRQGERAVIDALRQMGADVAYDPAQGAARVRGGRPLRPLEFDGDRATDAVMALVAAAAFADGTSRFFGIENLRYKESDRISDYAAALRRLGVDIEERQSELIVHGRPGKAAGGATIDAHHDHRLLMGVTIVALASRAPVTLSSAEHIAKSYPAFFADLARLGATISWPAAYDALARGVVAERA
ncbi:MAG TPA: 3-phosphoshikimate 1-carboxyvinyltransferase [Limnochordia bacterium]